MGVTREKSLELKVFAKVCGREIKSAKVVINVAWKTPSMTTSEGIYQYPSTLATRNKNTNL